MELAANLHTPSTPSTPSTLSTPSTPSTPCTVLTGLLEKSGAPPWCAGPLARILGLDELQRVYDAIPRLLNAHGGFFECCLAELGVSFDVSTNELERIPSSGATLVVANHPFGGLDGLVAGAALIRRRTDVRILANAWLGAIPELRPWLIDIDVTDSPRTVHGNAQALLAALAHLRAGGLLVVFPAGVVAHWQPESTRVEDPPWNRIVGVLARRSGATVIPMFFPGSNSALFQLSGLIHAGLRTALLPRELLARRGRAIRVLVGSPLRTRQYASLSDAALTDWMRIRTEAVGEPAESCPERTTPARMLAIGSANSRGLLSEWLRLDSASLLATVGRYCVLRANAAQIPRTLDELGRLRELTFRAIGEGTGAERDLDVFDLHYDHVFVIDREAAALVGAYRVGFCDRILRTQGLRGLYTNTLFVLKRPMLAQLETALELGRSFIRPEYQRQPLPLAMLWRGVGELLLREPRYDTLVGPASFSASSGQAMLRLAAALLTQTYGNSESERFVKPRRPLRARLSLRERDLATSFRGSLREMTSMLAELDPTGTGLPVLIQRYLELGGEVLSFSLDPDFGGCLDALIRVHVPSSPRAVLNRFLTPEGASSYLVLHGVSSAISHEPAQRGGRQRTPGNRGRVFSDGSPGSTPSSASDAAHVPHRVQRRWSNLH